MNWKEIGKRLSDQLHAAHAGSQDATITPEQAMTNAQLTYTAKAFLQACQENKSATEDDILWMQTLCDAAAELPITPYIAAEATAQQAHA